MNANLSYILWNPDDTALRIGSFAMHWYSLCWLIGLVLAYLIVRRLYKEQKIKDELFDPLFLYCFIGILVGARLGHCLFYQPDVYLSSWKHFVEMFLPIEFTGNNDWHFTGYRGLASHGGTFGLMIALWLYVRRTKLNIWRVLDNIAIATPATAFFIRIGNLMNSEIIGKPTDVPWAFIFAPPSRTALRGTGIRRTYVHRLASLPPPSAACGHRFLLRTLPDVYLHGALPHRVHQGDTGTLRGRAAHKHGSDSQSAVHSHRHRLHGGWQMDEASGHGEMTGKTVQNIEKIKSQIREIGEIYGKFPLFLCYYAKIIIYLRHKQCHR